MTLNTNVWLHGGIAGEDAFRLALGALLDAAERGGERETAIIEHRAAGEAPGWMEANLVTHKHRWPQTEEQIAYYRKPYDTMETAIGQGLPGIVECAYRQDGQPLGTDDAWDLSDPEYPYLPATGRACQVAMSWDTAYGYSDNGLSASSLHAKALVLLHETLPDGVTMSWQDESTSDVYQGLDGLAALLSSGDQASAWFANIVKPAIEAAHPDVKWS